MMSWSKNRLRSKEYFHSEWKNGLDPDQMQTDLNLWCFQKWILDPDQARQNFRPDNDLDSNYKKVVLNYFAEKS